VTTLTGQTGQSEDTHSPEAWGLQRANRLIAVDRPPSRGCFTHNYAKGLVSAPEDREPAVCKLIEGAGGKLSNFYFTTGDTDFMVISEANDSESIIAALLAAMASGSISDVKTARAWTGTEFKAIAEKASKAASHYRAPARANGY
jgi:uncharacterized protein with GYD domain